MTVARSGAALRCVRRSTSCSISPARLLISVAVQSLISQPVLKGRRPDRSGRARPRDASAITGQYPSVRARREPIRVKRSLDCTDRLDVALDDVVELQPAAAPGRARDLTWRVSQSR